MPSKNSVVAASFLDLDCSKQAAVSFCIRGVAGLSVVCLVVCSDRSRSAVPRVYNMYSASTRESGKGRE